MSKERLQHGDLIQHPTSGKKGIIVHMSHGRSLVRHAMVHWEDGQTKLATEIDHWHRQGHFVYLNSKNKKWATDYRKANKHKWPDL